MPASATRAVIVYYCYPFSALSDPAKLFNDQGWILSRPRGFESVTLARRSQNYLAISATVFLLTLIFSRNVNVHNVTLKALLDAPFTDGIVPAIVASRGGGWSCIVFYMMK